MQIHFVQHVSFEHPGSLLGWAESEEHPYRITHAGDRAAFPEPEHFDFLVLMGGPMGVYQEDRFPWLRREKDFLRATLAAGRQVLGICLGCQLLAEVLGGRVYPHTQPELGWWPLHTVTDHPFTAGLPARFDGFHFHGDTYDLPPGATRLFSSAGCAQQGFAWGDQALGLQFHPEIQEDLLRDMVSGEAVPWSPSAFVQGREEILSRAAAALPQQGDRMRRILHNFIR
ncbi:MAG TPA: type 1 glutamine amidotransferase [Chitinophagaceae bacterium]|nr:type 1 glutamine amidotransferase [Chitinophagaceae bacterium]